MKKLIALIITITLIHVHANTCMEKPRESKVHPLWNITGLLNWHTSEAAHDINFCDEVAIKVQNDPAIVHKKETCSLSRFYGKTPLEVAILVSKCEKCITFLRESGAQDTEFIVALQKTGRINQNGYCEPSK